LICHQNEYTYREIDLFASRLAESLVDIGLKRRDRVIIYLENSFEIVLALFGVLKAGGIFVPVNPDLKPKKLGYILHDTGAIAIIAANKKEKVVLDATASQPDLRHVIWVGTPNIPSPKYNSHEKPRNHVWENLTGPTITRRHHLPTCIDLDLAALVYTSGSSGKPKGVMCAHYNMISAVKSINCYLENRADDVLLNVLPLSFDYGLYQILLAFQVGATLVLEKGMPYPHQLIKLLAEKKITGFPLVPTIAALIGRMDAPQSNCFPDLRYITSTGDVLSADLIQKITSFFPTATLFSMYGLTECKRVSYLPPEQLPVRPTSVGIPIPNTEAFVVDDKGNPVSAGMVGELVVRGSHVMQGYWRLPDETQRKFRNGATRSDSWLYTGDLFKRDTEGFLYFMGRKGDIIKCKGEIVSPKEIENFLNGIKGILQSAVVGIPDAVMGQRILALVVIANASGITSAMIKNCCQQQLEASLVPHRIEIRDWLPVSKNGKIDKKQLIQEYAAQVACK
jgi:amino acid adenylation domain-containing protein